MAARGASAKRDNPPRRVWEEAMKAMATGLDFAARQGAWRRGISVLACAGALLGASGAYAQEADSEAPSDADIVVTGTLLRGVAPVGTNVVAIDREDIVATGAASANDLLASIPQVGNFATVPSGSGSFALPIVRPNIRNLGASGGTTTLVLLNGHRLVGAGVLQTSVDPSIFPPEIIDRVEVVPDGGSAVYGSDAIGGVINFITRKRFDGVAVNARYGFADNYQTADGNITVGKDWGSGSLLATYSYAWHDNIQNIDRDYTRADHTARGGSDFRTQLCSPGNIIDNPTNPLTGLPLVPFLPGNVPYALPGMTRNTTNLCEGALYTDLYPREERHSVFASLTQQLSADLEFSATAYWSRRDTTTLTQQPGFSGFVTAANPYFRPLSFSPAQSVSMAFDDVFGHTVTSKARFESYGITPGFKFNAGGGWQVRAEANVGRSYNLVLDDTINTAAASAALAGTTLATALNPYDPKASAPAVLAAIKDFQNYGRAVQELAELRVIADGALATLPGGDVRLAVGGEYHYENLDSLINLDRRGVFTNAINSYTSRNVKSAFGELLIPIFGEGNGAPGIRALSISGSIRYDDYNDIGGTTNPKIGFIYKPFDDFTIRGNYGTSFHAPSLADTTSTSDSRAQILLFSPFRGPPEPIPGLTPAQVDQLNSARPTIILAGGNPDLKPEKAKTWSLGFDWKPDMAPGLVVSATYYNVKFTDAIAVPPFLSPVLFSDPGYSSFYNTNPTLAEALAAVGNLQLNGAPSIQSLYAGNSPYILIDARRTNLGSIKTDGIDFNVAYARQTGFGSINASIAGTYTLSRKTQPIAGNPYGNDLENGTGRVALVATLGGSVGDFTALAKLNYRDGYPILGLPKQTKVDSFQTVDLFFGYSLADEGVLKDTMLTLNVDNLFDKDPPFIDTLGSYTNGSTLGRLISFGIRKKF